MASKKAKTTGKGKEKCKGCHDGGFITVEEGGVERCDPCPFCVLGLMLEKAEKAEGKRDG